MDSIMTRAMPFEQVRWNESNIDWLFYAGEQSFINRHFNFSPGQTYQNYYFNVLQQPVNLVTGYQRQHRKAVMFEAIDGADSQTTDQYTKIAINIANKENLHNVFSKACEASAISGLTMMQPYLDFTGDDPAQGQIKIKIWEYNSFIVDPFFRQPDMSDANYIWFQQYISKQEAIDRYGEERLKNIGTPGTSQRYSNFYFLPETSTQTQNNLYVQSFIWYRSQRKRKKLYSRSRKQFFDFSEVENDVQALVANIPDLEVVNVTVPTWKVCEVLNDQLMFQGDNPLGTDKPPAIPIFWNYDPHLNQPQLRSRSFTRPMRTPQFFLNYKIITNNDIAAATINAGYKRKEGAVANEDNLKKTGQGYDIVIKDGFELTDVEKIIPTAVPESDLALANQMNELIMQVSGVNIENWAGQTDKQISALTAMIKQAANLTVFQKYFDQWDEALKILWELIIEIIQNNWNAEKIEQVIGEQPSPFFYSKIFARYKTVVTETDLTPTQQNLQAQQLFEINERFGREIIPASMIIPKLNIQGKAEIIAFLQQQEQQQAAMAEQSQLLEQTVAEAKLADLHSKAMQQLAMARERHGRTESNIGLFEERLSEVQKNQALSTKAKMEAIEKMVDVIAKFGEVETMIAQSKIDTYNNQTDVEQMMDTQRAKASAEGNRFLTELMGSSQGMGGNNPAMQNQGMMR